MNEIAAFTLVALLLVMSPGPNAVLIVKTLSTQGRGASLLNILGLCTATFFHGALSVLGLSAIILQSAELFLLIKIIGALYLFYLGIKAIHSSFRAPKTDGLIANTGAPIVPKRALGNFTEGFLTQLLNPKVSMFYLAAFPQFIDFQQASYAHAVLLVSIHALIILCWFTSMTEVLGRMKKVVKESALTQAIGRWVQRVSGSLLVYFGGLLVSQEVNR